MKKISLITLTMVCIALSVKATQEGIGIGEDNGYLEVLRSVIIGDWRTFAFFACVTFTVIGRGIQIAIQENPSPGKYITLNMVWSMVSAFFCVIAMFSGVELGVEIFAFGLIWIALCCISFLGGMLISKFAESAGNLMPV